MKSIKQPVKRAIIAAVMVGIISSGCTMSGNPGTKTKGQPVNITTGGASLNKFPASPRTKPDGSKYRVAYVDINPYDVTGAMLYYVIESLKKDGWITYDSLPMSPENVDAGKLIDWLSKQNLGPYMEFAGDANYYLDYQGDSYVAKNLQDHVNNKKDIDLIFAMGTRPGEFVKALNLNVPEIVYGSIDPIGSGIVKSAGDSGAVNLWAQVDPAAFTRQLEFYYNTIHFKNIGMVYDDPTIAAIPDYEKAAKDCNFKITGVKINSLSGSSQADKDAYYANLKSIFEKLISEDKIDAYLINTDVIIDDYEMPSLFKLFTDAKIPVFVQIGDNYVKNGAFMCVSPRDYVGAGAFVAYTMGAIFNGAKPEQLPQEYVSSPYLSINLDVAKNISYTPTFEMLMSCENIYSAKSN
jgi:ABC-type uncharacterized transport system substrate-binding protein